MGIRSCMRPMNTQCKNLCSRVLSRLLDPSVTVNACHPIYPIYLFLPTTRAPNPRLAAAFSSLPPRSAMDRSSIRPPLLQRDMYVSYSPPPTKTNTSTIPHPIPSRWVVASDWPLHTCTGRGAERPLISSPPPPAPPATRHDDLIHTYLQHPIRSFVRGDWLTS